MNPSRAPRSSVASAATGTRDPFSISFTPGSINSVRQSRPRRRSGKGSDTCTSTWGRAWSDIPTAARVVRKGAPRMTRPQTQPHEGRRCRMGLQASGRAAQVRTGPALGAAFTMPCILPKLVAGAMRAAAPETAEPSTAWGAGLDQREIRMRGWWTSDAPPLLYLQ
jgi:hypothetical protein